MKLEILFILGLIIIAKTEIDNSKYCTIKSQQYPDEYLYSSKEQIASSFRVKVFVNRANERYLKTIDQIGWILVPVSEDAFNIISLKYNEILCEMDDGKKVNTYRLNGENDALKASQKCEWTIRQIDYDGSDYIIENVHSGQYLSTGVDLMKTGKFFRRNVYTHVSNEIVTKESHWRMECFVDLEDLVRSFVEL
jgi:hypothetical protein